MIHSLGLGQQSKCKKYKLKKKTNKYNKQTQIQLEQKNMGIIFGEHKKPSH